MKDKKNIEEKIAMEDIPIAKSEQDGSGEVEVPDKFEQLQKELAENKDRMLRLQADFDNFRKRTMKEKEEWYKYASVEIMEKLLVVLDNFERALQAMNTQHEEAQSVREGVEMIYRQLTEVLQKEGLEPIVAVGEIFDPNYHEALMQVPAEQGQKDGLVVEELRRGYLFKDRVIRHTMTKVAKNN